MARKAFGKFESIAKFLESYKAAEESAHAEAEKELPFEEKVESRRRAVSRRDVVEVAASLRERQDDGSQLHIELLITLTGLKEGDPDVNDDIQKVLDSGEDVFVAVRVGDSEGIQKPIVGLVDGVGLDLKGIWIPKDKAFAHGGEKLPVLHFTHRPVGFICVDEPAACYS